MPIYAFYPYRSDGAGLTFEAIELGSHLEAAGRADFLLARHPSAASIEVWCDDELVTTVERGVPRQDLERVNQEPEL